jgi:hypothetical protein
MEGENARAPLVANEENPSLPHRGEGEHRNSENEAEGEEGAGNAAAGAAAEMRTLHRIGGASVENLRLKSREAALDIPGISVLKVPTPREAAQQMRDAFPKAKALHQTPMAVTP